MRRLLPLTLEAIYTCCDKSTGCWVWLGKSQLGYAVYNTKRVHRVTYEMLHGKIPDNYHVHHQCHNKLCVNPNHLVAISGSIHTQIHKNKFLKEPRTSEVSAWVRRAVKVAVRAGTYKM